MKHKLAELVGDIEIAENLLAFYPQEEILYAMEQCDNEVFRRLVPRELAPYVFAHFTDCESTFLDEPEKVIASCEKMRTMAFEKRKRHHTVPRFYLGHFAARRGGSRQSTLNAYRKGQHLGELTLDNCSVRNYFYSFRDAAGRLDNSVEVGLSAIESVAANIIENIIRGDALGGDDRCKLSYFIAVMWMRTPQYREKVLMHMKGQMDAHLREAVADKARLERNVNEHNRETDATLSPAKLKEEIECGGINVEPNDALLLGATISRAEKLIPVVDSTNWLILEAPEGVQFVTSDAPVVLNSAIRPPPGHYVGWGTPQLEATFPLSDRICLLMTHDYRGERIQVDAAAVQEVTRRTVESCYEYVFAKWHDERLPRWFRRED